MLALICGLPLAFYQFGMMENQRIVAKRQKEEQNEREYRDMLKNANPSEIGEAFRRLYGIPEPKRD